MLDIVELLGADNPLARMIWDGERLYLSSLAHDARSLAAAAGISSGDCTPNEKRDKYVGRTFNLVFASTLPTDHEDYWRAEFIIEEGIEDDATIPITFEGPRHDKIDSGEFRLCGLRLPVTDGRGSCTLTQLRNSLDGSAVSLKSGHGLVLGRLMWW